jgi:hypothetical protein
VTCEFHGSKRTKTGGDSIALKVETGFYLVINKCVTSEMLVFGAQLLLKVKK